MPDSGWVQALKEAGLPFFSVAFVVFTGLALIWRLAPDTLAEPFVGARGYAEVLAVCSFLVVVSQGAWYVVKAPKKLPEPVASWLLRRRYATLGSEQRNLLRATYQRGTRRFEMHDTKARWFEELRELGFVEPAYILGIVAGSPTPYEVPVRAWKVLEKLAGVKQL